MTLQIINNPIILITPDNPINLHKLRYFIWDFIDLIHRSNKFYKGFPIYIHDNDDNYRSLSIIHHQTIFQSS